MLRKLIFTSARTLVADAGSAVRRSLCATVAGLAFISSPAMSVELASISHPIQAVYATNAFVSYDIELSSLGGASSFMFNFILPQDYSDGGKIQVVPYFWQSGGPDCTMRFGPTMVQRGRPGLELVLKSPGLTPTDRHPTVDLVGSKIAQKVYTVDGTRALHKGDWLRVAFERNGSHADDSCGTVHVLGIDIRYQPVSADVR
jgi:hypothetical protein